MVQSRYDWFAPPSANTKKRRRHKDKYRVVPLPLVCTTLCKDKDTCNHKKKTKTKRQTKGQMQRWLSPDILGLHYLWNATLCNSLLMIMTKLTNKVKNDYIMPFFNQTQQWQALNDWFASQDLLTCSDLTPFMNSVNIFADNNWWQRIESIISSYLATSEMIYFGYNWFAPLLVLSHPVSMQFRQLQMLRKLFLRIY